MSLDKIGRYVLINVKDTSPNSKQKLYAVNCCLMAFDILTNQYLVRINEGSKEFKASIGWNWNAKLKTPFNWVVAKELITYDTQFYYKLISEDEIITWFLPDAALIVNQNTLYCDYLRAQVTLTHEQRINGLNV